MTDITIINHGSICVLIGETEAGNDWLDMHLDSEAQRWGGGYVAEPRYVPAIIAGAMLDGLEIDA